MTGELADCFATRAVGVQFIVESTLEAARGRRVVFYQTGGDWASAESAIARPMQTAAANWHALAAFAGRYVRWHAGATAQDMQLASSRSFGAPLRTDHTADRALLIDIGSTTSDLIPLADGAPAARGTTDLERLLSGELVYTGVERSPVCALLTSMPWRGEQCPVARELFATALDAYLILGDVPESPDFTQTADGGPATIDAARVRLARMVCADRTQFRHADVVAMAQSVSRTQKDLIVTALRRLPVEPSVVILSGQGEFLGRRAVGEVFPRARYVALSERLGQELSRAATAYALARLAEEAMP